MTNGNSRNLKKRVKSPQPHIEEMGFMMEDEIGRLEDLILDNLTIPILRKILIDEDRVMNQVDVIRMNIPDCIKQAQEILQQRDQIIIEAQNTARKSIEMAERKAEQILNESGLIRQAREDAEKITQKAIHETDELRHQTQLDITNKREQFLQESIRMKQDAEIKAQELQKQADDYVDNVLLNLEKTIAKSLNVIQTTNRNRQNPQ